MVNVQCVQIDYRLFIFYRNRPEMSRGNILLWKRYYPGKRDDNISNSRKIPEVPLKVERYI